MKTCFGALVWAFAAVSVGAGVVPLDLRCEGTRQALAVSAAPRFSWRVEAAKRGQSQTAWQILVASKAEILADDRGDLWDSGKTAAARTPSVKYAGSPLSAGARYHWKVRCRDAGDQPDAWSEPAVMEIAPTKPADWQGASWINPMASVCGQIKGTRKNARGEEALIGGPGAPAIAWQQDIDTARGGDGEIYQPDSTFHAFRYMEIAGLMEAPKLEDIRGLRMHSALPDAGSFSCSNELFNRIQKITRHTFTNNVISVQSDCPHRERFGDGGDIAVTSEAYLMNCDMAGFYAKTVRDWADAARPAGNFTDTSPFVGVPYCGVGWAMVQPLLIERIYQHYGSQSLVEEQHTAAIRGLDLEASPPRRPARPFTGCKPAAAATISSCLHDHENVHQAI
jgi:hypothetical protein